MTIHEAAEQTGLKEANIRFYEKEGLLCPKRNAGNQYRSYTQDDLEELERIRFFRLLGFSCAEIAQLQRGDLALPDALERRQTALKENGGCSCSVSSCARQRRITPSHRSWWSRSCRSRRKSRRLSFRAIKNTSGGPWR